jgi:hypothetical protein
MASGLTLLTNRATCSTSMVKANDGLLLKELNQCIDGSDAMPETEP